MEKIKKTILQMVTTGETTGGKIIIVPILSPDYYYRFKIGLKQHPQDIGFFDAFTEPIPPEPPVPPGPPTFYLLDSASNQFVDNNGDNFIYE